MGGLVNGRRGGRSPPLMIGALIACILVLGFNYWLSSSRNLELQTKLYELESQVRRGAAERGAAEVKKNEFEVEIQRQKDKFIRIESQYKKQLDGAQNTCGQDKSLLQQNISTSTKIIQDLKGQLILLNSDLGKLESCQSSLDTLNKKLTYDMTQCNTQILSQKELCDERIAAAKLEAQKKMGKLIPPQVVSAQVNAGPSVAGKPPKDEVPLKAGVDETKTTPVVSHLPDLSQPKAQEPPETMTNEIRDEKTGVDSPVVVLPSVKDLSSPEAEPVPSTSSVKQDILLSPRGAVGADSRVVAASKLQKKTPLEDNEVEMMDNHAEDTQAEDADAGMEDMLAAQENADKTANSPKVQDPEDYDGDEQIGGLDEEKPRDLQRETMDNEMERELADYNGDDENEGEFEADKQAALAQH